jgi:adenylate cyclase
VRINVELVNGLTGEQVWGERYDRQLGDIFTLQDEIVESVVTTVGVQIPLLERSYVLAQRTKNLEAYDDFLRACELMLTRNPDGFCKKARRLLDKAIELDSDYADAYQQLSLSYFICYALQWDQDPSALERAGVLAERAAALDDSNSTAYALIGWVARYKGEENKAVFNARRAVSVGPNDSFAWLAFAGIMQAEDPEGVLDAAQRGIRLDPLHHNDFFFQKGWAYLSLRRFGEAASALKEADQANPWTHAGLVYAYIELGLEQQARAEAAEVMLVSPQFSVEEAKRRYRVNWDNPVQRQLLIDLSKAGLK